MNDVKLETPEDMRKSLQNAKNELARFRDEGSAAYETLPDSVKQAIDRVAKKAATTSPKKSVLGFLVDLFPTVGTKVDEFDLWKKTKMGRAEMLKKIKYANKKADADQVMNIEFTEDENGDGTYELISVGEDEVAA